MPNVSSLEKQLKQAYQNWVVAAETAHGDAEVMLALYEKEAIVLATFEYKLLAERADKIRYFQRFTGLPNLKVATHELHTQIYEGCAINSGIYHFTYDDNNKSIDLSARFSFAYHQHADEWLIVNHHSSVLPSVSFLSS